ncbi:MAG: SRPBCC domain-containing protein [Candidatus Berkelbacteria bacterium]|nr:MAG: SRPBCC domain-containing protein [Candidatus Berkelbacteria bacterium]QQG52030.1 MAG: SRPBCC domain-containing protein [Candidatus Berkelbacteria bacterium]
MDEIHLTVTINAPITAVWKALTDPAEIDKWEGGPAIMDEKVGSRFEFWGGEIHGTNTIVVPKKKLVQDWEYGDWPSPSTVVFELFEEGDVTRVELTQTGHPEEETKDLIDGWKSFYLGAIKELLEDKQKQP